MPYLAHTAHWQFLGLVMGFLAWILTMATTGLNEWRLWDVDNVSVVTSGVAWVGIWRVCFYSHAFATAEVCQSISIWDQFAPVEIHVAQVLMMLAVICGLVGNISAAYAMRMVYFSVGERGNIRRVFVLSGTLYLLTATCSFVPLVWNMSSVLNNSTIDFPPKFFLPAAPVKQKVGSAIGVGLLASTVIALSGLLFLCYRYVRRPLSSKDLSRDTRDPLDGLSAITTPSQQPHVTSGENCARKGRDNPTFNCEEAL
ncbi:claudin-34 [Thalassophryne amazonica]|uniref:claudin-34 n=1 Tax=Thalassophryne amazonica TaxID=390379 RepID=UPI001471E6A8|nr:claudin-34 [Thalassophryne amazonica]